MRVLTCSRNFPKGHPKAGDPTWFVEKILNSINQDKPSQIILDNIKPELKDYVNDFALLTGAMKHTTIRAGSRWKAGDMASLRVWADKPYRSKQVEFAQVEVKKVWKVSLKITNNSEVKLTIDGVERDARRVHQLAANDGLESLDFINWFNVHPMKKLQVFSGQIICWSNEINY